MYTLFFMRTKLVGIKEFRQNLTKCYKEAIRHHYEYLVLRRSEPIFAVRAISRKEGQKMVIKRKDHFKKS